MMKPPATVADLENRLAALIRRVNASDLNPGILVAHGASIYAEILGVAEEADADLIVVGSHRPAMKDYLLGTNAARVVRHARCSVLVARE
jgi:nucleotide-binding universal stress UspA family protein